VSSDGFQFNKLRAAVASAAAAQLANEYVNILSEVNCFTMKTVVMLVPNCINALVTSS